LASLGDVVCESSVEEASECDRFDVGARLGSC